MRVSERQRYQGAVEQIQSAKSHHLKTMNTLASQKRVESVHDDPVGYHQIIKGRQKLSKFKTYERNLNFGKGFLQATEVALKNIYSSLGRAQEIATMMANDTYSQEDRRAAGNEVSHIIKAIIQAGNTKYNSRFIFSGYRVDSLLYLLMDNFLEMMV